MFLFHLELTAQTIYPPNHSFEDDSITFGIKPWYAVGDFEIITSVNMHFAPDKKYFFELLSKKFNSVYTYSKLQIKFPVSERVRFLNFVSMFRSFKEGSQFNVKLQMTKYHPVFKRSFLICNMDTMMDTICNVRDYRNVWFYHKVDLKRYYLSNETPDSCYLELSCDFKHEGSTDFFQILDLDNFVLTSNVNEQVSVSEQSKFKTDVWVYPNPSSGMLNVDLSQLQDASQLEVISSDGRSVMSRSAFNGVVGLDVSSLVKGLYLLKITNYDHTQIFKEIVIE